MLCECKYDPKVDLKPVSPFGAVDLVSAMRTGSVPANIRASENSFNEIDNPNSISGRPSDIFEEAQMSKATLDYVPPKEDKQE